MRPLSAKAAGLSVRNGLANISSVFVDVLSENANGKSKPPVSMIGNTESMTSRMLDTVSRLLDWTTSPLLDAVNPG